MRLRRKEVVMYTVMGEDAAVVIIGPNEAKKVWGVKSLSLRTLQRQEDTFRNKNLLGALESVFDVIGIEEAYAPNIAANSAAVVHAEVIRSHSIKFGTRGALEKKLLWRNYEIPADGIMLPRGEAFVMSAAGYPVLIAEGGEYMIVAHAGRDSLIDRALVGSGERSRQNMSVVTAIMERFWQYKISPSLVSFRVMFAMPSSAFVHHFEHSVPGKFNRKLLQFLQKSAPNAIGEETGESFCLDLGALIMEQGIDAGVSETVVTESLEDHPELAYARDGGDPTRRNLIVVKHL